MLLDKHNKIIGISRDNWKKIFSDRLTNLLKERNMCQSDLAKASGLSRSRINDYISMKSVPTIFASINMAYALDITVEELIGCDSLVHD